MYNHRNDEYELPHYRSRPTIQNTNIYPAQVRPAQHIIKKNIIVHVVPHFHPQPLCTPSHCIHPRRRRF